MSLQSSAYFNRPKGISYHNSAIERHTHSRTHTHTVSHRYTDIDIQHTTHTHTDSCNYWICLRWKCFTSAAYTQPPAMCTTTSTCKCTCNSEWILRKLQPPEHIRSSSAVDMCNVLSYIILWGDTDRRNHNNISRLVPKMSTSIKCM